jgi:DNA invertase Pin-like site-specific DNA recombinase
MKYIAYYRVSTKKQGKSGLGLESQKAIIAHFTNGHEIIKEYTDILSGSTMERPQLQEAITECTKNGYTLIVAKIDRLSRTTEHALEIYATLNSRLTSCDVPNLDKFTLTIFMAIADREKELVRIRTIAALAAKKAKGFKLGTPGNLTDSGRRNAWKANKAKAARNENNMRALMLIYEYRDKGMILQDIADRLNGNGFKTSTGSQFMPVTVKRLYDRYCEKMKAS